MSPRDKTYGCTLLACLLGGSALLAMGASGDEAMVLVLICLVIGVLFAASPQPKP